MMKVSKGRSVLCAGLAAMLAGVWTGPVLAQPAAKAAKPSGKVPSGPGSLTGVWMSNRFNADRSAQRGGALATPTEQAAEVAANRAQLTPWAEGILAQRVKDAQAGHPYAYTKARCLPAGTPQSLFPPAALPVQILETAGQVTILFEEFNQFRIIHLQPKHDEDPDPGFFGNSIGHWEGDTLVVDTIAINEQTTLGNMGAPHSADLHVVERIRRTTADTLEIKIALTDPKAIVGTWNMQNTLKRVPGTRLAEYFCENDRNTPDEAGKSGVQLPGR